MLDKVFWHEPETDTLECRLTARQGNKVRVNRSIFYAQSGGQESDEGNLGGIRVIEATKIESEGDIEYTLAETPDWEIGATLLMRINPLRRKRLTRLHFAAEMVLECIVQHFADPSMVKIGAHIGEDKARIDFIYPRNIAEIFPEISTHVHALIDADLPILSAFADPQKGWRYWEIEGFARVPCGGTHPRSTAEVGALTFKRKNIGKHKERVEIKLKNEN